MLRPPRPDGAHAPRTSLSSSRFIDCHRRVSIINHLHCNRTAPRSDTEAPGRFSASAYNSRTAKSFQSTTPWRQWKCVVFQSAAIYPIRQTVFARWDPPARETHEITEADWRCIALRTRCIIRSIKWENMFVESSEMILMIRMYISHDFAKKWKTETTDVKRNESHK